MKPVLMLAVMIMGLSAKAIDITDLQIAGSGCSVPTGGHELIPIAGSVERFGIPIMMNIDKLAANLIARKSCTMSLAVKLNAGEKLQVIDVAQKVKLTASKGAKASIQLEVFLAGSQGVPLKAEVSAVNKQVRSSQLLNAAGVVAESECGKDVIVRANSSVMLQGAARSKVSSDMLALTLRVVACQ